MIKYKCDVLDGKKFSEILMYIFLFILVRVNWNNKNFE